MFKLLSTLCFLTNLFFGSTTVNNELVRNRDITYHKEKWHTHDVADGQYTFVVTLILIDQSVVTAHCTGSLIGSTWVLSSAHCFYDLIDKKFYAWYGNFTKSPLVSRFYSEVLEIFIHPDFYKTKFIHPGFFFGDNDISLLRVGKILLPSYGRLSSVDHTKMYGLPVTYIGGAAKNTHVEEEYKPLHVAEGIIIYCGITLTMWSKYVLCVTPKCSDKLHHPLHGDFGGPFIYDGKIVGVMTVNFKIPKTFMTSNGLTPVSPYKDWIRSVLSKKGKL